MAAAAQVRPVAQRQHLLETLFRMDDLGRVAATAPQVAEPAGGRGGNQPGTRGGRQRQRPGKKGGAHTGPNPVDRGKNGCKRHIIGEAGGIPLTVQTTAANVRDEVPFVDMLDSLPPVKMPSGRSRYLPDAAVGDRGYGFTWIIARVAERRIKSLLAPRGSPHGSGLGTVRYVIERTMSWMGSFRRIDHCHEATGKSWQAFNELACCVICANRLRNINRKKLAA